MKLGSLFDGIGGFPLVGSWLGFETVWASEIEEKPISITKRHFPNMEHLGDITKINGAEIEPVDLLTFGSPCQDLSVAGKRAGLEGSRSSLFLDAVRIIYEMRKKTNGEYPKFAVWENVPGAFSSNKGLDFRAVLEEIGQAEIPMPKYGKWANAGMVRTENCGIAWRTLDAQYWGVPQRRKRIFLIADFRDEPRPEILFEPEGVSRYFTQSKDTRERIAGNIESCFGESICVVFNEETVTSPSNAQNPKNNGPCHTLGASGTGRCICIQGNCIDRADTAGCNGKGWNDEDVSYTLNTVDRPAVCYENSGFSKYTEGVGTLRASGGDLGGGSENIIAYHTVRRLTPLECERLQGFRDYWTLHGADGEEISDTQRYKALGNSVALPCVEFVLQKLIETVEVGK